MVPWCSHYHHCTSSFNPELRFCAGSNPARGVSEIRDGEDLWQWSRLEIRLNVFRRSTIPQKQFIIIIIIIIINYKGIDKVTNPIKQACNNHELIDQMDNRLTYSCYCPSVTIIIVKNIDFTWHSNLTRTCSLENSMWSLQMLG